MAGGKWTILDTMDPSQRSGFYINFVSDVLAGVAAGASGVVAIPVTAPWGPEDTIVAIANPKELEATFSAKGEGNAYFQINQALKSARLVLAYRMAAGAARATVTLQSATSTDLVRVEAKHSGGFGNDLTVSVGTSLADATKKEFKVNTGSALLERFTFDGTADDLVAKVANSAYVALTKLAVGTVKDYANLALSGGDSGLDITAAEYTAALSAFEGRAFEWNTLAVPTGDKPIQTAVKDYIARLRSEGYFVTTVMGHVANGDFEGALAQAKAMNFEGVIYHNIGAVIEGQAHPPAEMVGLVAGMVAGAGAEASVSYGVIEGIDSLANVLTNTQIRAANANGLLVAFNDGQVNRIEKGINTLTIYGDGQHEGYSKIKVIAVLDAIGNALTGSANRNYLGKVLNDEDGQQALIGAIKDAFDVFVQGRLIKPGYVVELDPNRASVGDQLFLNMAVTPVDAMEEIYATIRVGR